MIYNWKNSSLQDRMLVDALSCLTSSQDEDTYTIALIAYVFSKLNNHESMKTTMMEKLENLATNEGTLSVAIS